MSSYEPPFVREGALGQPVEQTDSRAVFGQVMGLVAVTVGFFALGAYLGRNLTGGGIWLFFIGAFACVFGANIAAQKRIEWLAITLLFGIGLLLGLAVGPVLAFYAKSDPAILWQAGGATALFVGALGSYGYATKRDLSTWARTLFWLLIGLIVFGIVLIFVNIPGGQTIYAVLGLAIFGAYTIFDFNRLRRANMDQTVPIAVGIFLDVVNIFLFFLQIFGGGRR
jgi:FtsH-binding integral membrane protein